MDAKTLVLYLCINNQVKKYVITIATEVCNHCVPMYYVDVNRLCTLWNSCGLVSVQETIVIWSLHCSIAIVIHLTGS